MSSASRKKADLEAMKLQKMIEAERMRAYDQGVNAGCAKTLILMNYILHNRFGFGKKRFETRQSGWICNQCSGVVYDVSNGDTDYCPNCGAKMNLGVVKNVD